MTYRVLAPFRACPDGHSEVLLAPGDVVTQDDHRVAGGVLHIALSRGWVEAISSDPAAPAAATRSPGRARKSPARARRAAPQRKG